MVRASTFEWPCHYGSFRPRCSMRATVTMTAWTNQQQENSPNYALTWREQNSLTSSSNQSYLVPDLVQKTWHCGEAGRLEGLQVVEQQQDVPGVEPDGCPVSGHVQLSRWRQSKEGVRKTGSENSNTVSSGTIYWQVLFR